MFGYGNQHKSLKQKLMVSVSFGCGFKSEICNCPFLSHAYLVSPPPYVPSYSAEIHQTSNTVSYIFKNRYIL